jgi:DNA polymerase-3 subunit delta
MRTSSTQDKALDQLEQRVRSGDAPKCVIVTSRATGRKNIETDEFLSGEYIRLLVPILLPDEEDRESNIIRFSGSDRTFRLQEAVDEMRSMAFFGGRKVVLVRRFGARAGVAKELKILEDRTIWAEGNTLILSLAQNLTPAFEKKMDKAHDVVVLDASPPRKQGLLPILENMASRRGCRLNRDAGQLLIEFTGPNLSLLWPEVCKLSDYVGDRCVITRDDVSAVTQETRDHDVFAMVDAISAQDSGRTLLELTRLMNQQVQPLQIVHLLSTQYRRLLLLRHAIDNQSDMDEAAQAASIPPWLARKMMPLARRIRRNMCIRALAILKKTDHDLKTLRVPDRLILEDQVLRILGR